MVNILVEIGGFRQLSRLREAELLGLFESLKGLAGYAGGACIYEERGTLLFELDTRRGAAGSSGALIAAIDDALRQRKRLLGGFTIVAEDYDEIETSGFIGELPILRRVALLSDRNDAILLGRRLRRKVRTRFLCNGGGEFAEVAERRDVDHGRVPPLASFLARPDIIREIRAALRRLQELPETSWLDLWGAAKTPNNWNVKAALAEASALPTAAPWIELRSASVGLSVYDPFLGAIRREMLSVAGDYLSRSERLLWEQRRSIFAFGCPDHPAEDFLAAYSLYLLAYSRFMTRHGFPAVIICEGVDHYSAETIDILARLLRRLSGHAPLIAICLREEEVSLAPLEPIPHERIGVPPFCAEEVKARLEQSELAEAVTAEELMQLTGGRGHLLFHAFLLLAQAAEDAAVQDAADKPAPAPRFPELLRGKTVSAALLERLKEGSRRILYAATLARGVLEAFELAPLFRSRGLAEEEWSGELGELTQAGFVDEAGAKVLMPEVAVTFAGEFATEDLPGAIAEFAHRLWREGAFRPPDDGIAQPARSIALFTFLSRYGRFDQALDVFIEMMMHLLDEGNVAQALHYLEHEDLFRMTIGPDEMRKRDFFLELFALRAATLYEAREQADLRLSRLKEMGGRGDLERGLLELACAQHLHATGEHRSALESAKRSLLCAQASGSPPFESKADVEIGLCMLSAAKFEEAEEYFSIAAGEVDEGAPSYERVRGLCFEAVSLYLFGNISKALRTIDRAREAAARACRREWQRYALFLKGRCLFTLGRCDDAARVFRAGASFCGIYPHEEASEVFESWCARAASIREPALAIDTLGALAPRAETLYFAAEASARLGDYSRAFDLLERSLELQRGSEARYLPSELVPWTSGFAGVEDRALLAPGGEGVLHNLTRALRAYAQGKRDAVADGIAELTRMTREDRLSSQDPYLYLYYFLHSLVVPSGEGELLVNKLTALSKALKHVQQRASRIDEVKLRQSYLRDNILNAALLDDARRYRLM